MARMQYVRVQKKIKAACGLPLCAVGVSHNVLQEFNGSRCQIKIQSVLTDLAFWLPGNPGVIHKHQCFTVNQQTLNWVNTRYMPAYLDICISGSSHFPGFKTLKCSGFWTLLKPKKKEPIRVKKLSTLTPTLMGQKHYAGKYF